MKFPSGLAAILIPFVLWGLAGCSGAESAPLEGSEIMSIDELLSIQSVVSAGEGSHWARDGSTIMFVSEGRLRTVSPDGGPLEELGAPLGSPGVFLASQQPKHSPDGEWISYISGADYVQEIWLWSESERRSVQLTNLGARINSYNWSPDGRWISLAGDRHGAYDIWKVEVATGNVIRLTSDLRNEVFPTWTPDSRSILYVRLDEAWVDHEVFSMDTEGANRRLVVSNTGMFDYQDGGKLGYPMVSPDGSRVLFRSHRSGWLNYWLVAVEGGTPRQIAPEQADQSHAQWSPDGSTIAFTSNTNGTHVLRTVSSDGGSPTDVVSPDGMGVVSNPSWSPDGSRISYALGSPTRPDDLFVVSLSDATTVQLTQSAPAPEIESQLIAPEKVHYTSTENLNIPAYLYTPLDVDPDQTVPALLWIHGGPTSQFHDSFQQHVQFFVQRGYAVLLPNIRGSSGYGLDFEDANNGCWGRCDLEDVLAGVDYLKAQPYIDPDNIGITGTSYGGIMSMAAPAFAPGVFQAAIPIAGYADYPHFMEEQELRHIKLVEYELGPMSENRELYEDLSAINFVADVRTPFFVIHGGGYFPESDASLNFVRELQRYYKPVKYEVYPNENYYIYKKENRRQMLQDMLAFLDQHLGGHRIVSSRLTGY